MSCGTATAEWIGYTRAARMLGTHRKAVAKLAEERRLTARVLPGCHPRVLLSDVERLARESIKPAAAG